MAFEYSSFELKRQCHSDVSFVAKPTQSWWSHSNNCWCSALAVYTYYVEWREWQVLTRVIMLIVVVWRHLYSSPVQRRPRRYRRTGLRTQLSVWRLYHPATPSRRRTSNSWPNILAASSHVTSTTGRKSTWLNIRENRMWADAATIILVTSQTSNRWPNAGVNAQTTSTL